MEAARSFALDSDQMRDRLGDRQPRRQGARRGEARQAGKIRQTAGISGDRREILWAMLGVAAKYADQASAAVLNDPVAAEQVKRGILPPRGRGRHLAIVFGSTSWRWVRVLRLS